MKTPVARCPVCFQLVKAERPELECLNIGDFYFLEEHKASADPRLKGPRCSGSDSRISAMKLEAYVRRVRGS